MDNEDNVMVEVNAEQIDEDGAAYVRLPEKEYFALLDYLKDLEACLLVDEKRLEDGKLPRIRMDKIEQAIGVEAELSPLYAVSADSEGKLEAAVKRFQEKTRHEE